MEKSWRRRAHRLRALHPDWSNAEIARRCGVTAPAVWKLFNPEKTREMNRVQNAKRNEAKQQWAREHDRQPCSTPGCENLMAPGAHRRGGTREPSTRCQECYFRERRADRMARAEFIAWAWAEGWSMKAIADECGMPSVNVLGVEMNRLRAEGLVDLPLRKRVGWGKWTNREAA